MTQKFFSPVFFFFVPVCLLAALCLAGCATEKQYSGDTGKTPAAAAPAASAAPADNSRAKPGSDEAGGK